MASTLASLIEELEDFQDAHDEYDDLIDDAEVEALEIYDSIGAELQEITRSVEKLRVQDDPDRESLEEIEDRLAEVADAFAELAASL